MWVSRGSMLKKILGLILVLFFVIPFVYSFETTEPQQCEPNDQRVSNKCVEVCDTTGMKWEESFCCDKKEPLFNRDFGGYTCESNDYSFIVNVKAIKGCGIDICSSDFGSLLRCQSDGTYKEVNCRLACESTSNGAKCKDGNNKSNNSIFYVIVGLLFLIILFLVFRKKKK